MRIWNGIGGWPEEGPDVVATIGNFDGVHRGHRAVLERVVEHARGVGASSVLIGFHPHPLAIVAPERRPRLLQTRRQKLADLEDAGLTELLLLDFDAEMAALTGEEFFDRVLDRRVRLRAVYVGENFRFGHARRGDLDLLRSIGSRRGFDVRVVPPVLIDDRPVSSSVIREAVALGDVEAAWRMLGRPFAIVGEVVPGAGRGRSLDCPTANLDVENDVVPGSGVYVSETVARASRFPSVTNVGVRPTFGGEVLTVETHVLDFEEDLYHERMELRFLARLRDEMRFDTVAQLADQIARDRAAAEAYFQNRPLVAGPV